MSQSIFYLQLSAHRLVKGWLRLELLSIAANTRVLGPTQSQTLTDIEDLFKLYNSFRFSSLDSDDIEENTLKNKSN